MSTQNNKTTPISATLWRNVFMKRLHELRHQVPAALRVPFVMICDAESHSVDFRDGVQMNEGLDPRAQFWFALSTLHAQNQETAQSAAQLGPQEPTDPHFSFRIGGDKALGQQLLDFVLNQKPAQSWLQMRAGV